MSTRNTALIHLILTVAMALSLAACQNGKGRSQSSSSGPQTLDLGQTKLIPLSKENIAPAKDFLKQLGSLPQWEAILRDREIQTLCTFPVSKVDAKIDATLVRVGAQFDFSRQIQSAGDACPVEMVRHTEANLTFWSAENGGQAGTTRTRAEIREEIRLKEEKLQVQAGFRSSEFKFRIIEDGRHEDKTRSHLRAFGTGQVRLLTGQTLELRIRTEQKLEAGRRIAAIRVRTKDSSQTIFSYALQLEERGRDIRITKAFVGDVPLTEGEIRDLKAVAFGSRFLLSIP